MIVWTKKDVNIVIQCCISICFLFIFKHVTLDPWRFFSSVLCWSVFFLFIILIEFLMSFFLTTLLVLLCVLFYIFGAMRLLCVVLNIHIKLEIEWDIKTKMYIIYIFILAKYGRWFLAAGEWWMVLGGSVFSYTLFLLYKVFKSRTSSWLFYYVVNTICVFLLPLKNFPPSNAMLRSYAF